jgi:hypothetical protein
LQDGYSWNSAQLRYTYGYSWTTTSYSSGYSDCRYFGTGPLDLVMVRDNPNQRWSLYSRSVGDNEATFQLNMYNPYLYDSWITGQTYYVTYPWRQGSYGMAQFRIGMFAENQQSFNIKVGWDKFVRGPASSWPTFQTYINYYATRNNTFNTQGACAISRSVNRIAPAPARSTFVSGLINGETYTVNIRSEGPSGVSAYVTVPWNPVPYLGPPGVSGGVVPDLFLDSATLSTTSGLTRWPDSSPKKRDFIAPATAQRPQVTKATGELTAGVVFDGASNYMWLPDVNDRGMDIDSDSSGNRAQTTLFILYKPGSTTSNMGLFGKGAYSYSRYAGWGTYAQEQDPWTSQRLAGFKGKLNPMVHRYIAY